MSTGNFLNKRGIHQHWPLAVVLCALGILAGTIFLGTRHLRGNIRDQIVQRNAVILHEVALLQQQNLKESGDLGAELDDVTDQLTVALHISRFKGVVAARLYSAEGDHVMAFPAYVAPASLPESYLADLERLLPASRFLSSAVLTDTFTIPPPSFGDLQKEVPRLDVWIPLHEIGGASLKGIAQFVIDGQPIAREFHRLDRSLALQASLAFLVAGLLLSVTILWAFQRLSQSNRLLVNRTRDLRQANEQLALAARSSALGAVTAHLIHGLTNPLSGLSDFMQDQDEDTTRKEEWQNAVASTRRMQTLIEDAVRVLGEEQSTDHYEVSLGELVSQVKAKCDKLAASQQVRLDGTIEQEITLDNRIANLVLLILENLIQNAIQASSRGSQVSLSLSHQQGWVRCRVADQGTGIPVELTSQLFAPCRSSKQGGSGIGLAICSQLANHLGAALNLESTSPEGTVFLLTFPVTPNHHDSPSPAQDGVPSQPGD